MAMVRIRSSLVSWCVVVCVSHVDVAVGENSNVGGGMQQATVPQTTADKFGAKQLNGDPPVYLIRRNPASTKWVLFLEGGGWCFGATTEATIAACAGRGGFKPPSGTNAASEKQPAPGVDYGGILGANCTTNPSFCEWNAAFLHYKDGSSFGSYRPDPIMVNFKNGSSGAKMWMRGRASFDAIISDLQTTYGMSSATEVILSGGSAGGLATFYNLDHLADILGPGVKLTGAPDAGFFLDAKNINGEYSYRANFQGADPVWNVTGSGGTNKACLATYEVAEQWKCLMAEYIVPHLKTPVFVMNSIYDAYQLPNILGTSCSVSTKDKPCNMSASIAYGSLFRETVKDVVTLNARNGVYASGCYVHEQNVNYCSNQGVPNCVGWSPLESGSKKWGYSTAVAGSDGKQYTPQEAFTNWYFSRTPSTNTYIDQSVLQTNPTCNFLGHPV